MRARLENYVVIAIALLSLIALTGSAQAQPDLVVDSIDINPEVTSVVDVIFINQTNNITAVINNTAAWVAGGANDTVAFDVSFVEDNQSVNMGTVNVPGGLAGGNTTTVFILWTPTCADYPTVQPGHPCTSMNATINVTADCNGAVNEANETNNYTTKFLSKIQVWSKTSGSHMGNYDVTAGVVNNGYKAVHFDCDANNKPLSQFKSNITVNGGCYEINTSGKRNYPFDGGENETREHSISIPGTAAVKEARLYVYWYDYFYSFDDANAPESGIKAVFDVNCSRVSDGTWLNFSVPNASYTDQKGYGKYNSPKGTYVYNVTSLVTASGDYNVTINNTHPNGYATTLLGEMLFVVYENTSAYHKTMQLWWLEGNEYMIGKESKGSSEAEATANVTFEGAVDTSNTSATLISVVAQGMTTGTDMLFNGAVIKEDAWDAETEAYPQSIEGGAKGTRINIEYTDVKSLLVADNNTMGFRDTGTGGMQASNAFLIVCSDTPMNVSTCDASGNVKTSFLEHEDMYVMGSGLDKGNYSVYIQPEPVEMGETLVAGDDPSGAQNWTNITVDNAPFGPTEIWHNITRPGGITFEEWDVVLDKDAGGTYSADDGITSACKEGGVAPVPEMLTIALFGMGLLTLTGYVYLGRRRRRA